MTLWLAIVGWALATALAVQGARLVRRLELVARAEHELRGPVSALALAVEALARVPELRRRAVALDVHLDRLRLGLADLDAARDGRRAAARTTDVAVEGVARAAAQAWEPAARDAGGEISFEWRAGPVVARADRARLSQALGNVLANAVEHGGERITVSGERHGDGLRIAVRDERGEPAREDRRDRVAVAASDGSVRRRDRGRGLGIAARALSDMDASLDAPDLRGVLERSHSRRVFRRVSPTSGRTPPSAAGRPGERPGVASEVRLDLPLVETSPP